MKSLSRGFIRFERFLNYIGAFLLILMMLLVTGDVTGRYLFHKPILGALECVEFFMVAVIFLGFSYTQFLKAHIKVELLTSRLPPRWRHIFEVITYFLGLCLFSLIVWHGGRMAIDSWKMGETTWGAVELPVYPAKTIVPFGSFVLCIRFIFDIFEGVSKIRRE